MTVYDRTLYSVLNEKRVVFINLSSMDAHTHSSRHMTLVASSTDYIEFFLTEKVEENSQLEQKLRNNTKHSSVILLVTPRISS